MRRRNRVCAETSRHRIVMSKERGVGMRMILLAVFLAAVPALPPTPANAAPGAYRSHLAAKAADFWREGNYRAAARWYIEAEQLAVGARERGRSAYWAGCARLKQGLVAEAQALFERALAHDGEGPYAGYARVSLQECAALANPLVDFPDGLYLWVQSRGGPGALAALDRWLDVWERVRYPLLAVPLLLIAVRLLRRKAA